MAPGSIHGIAWPHGMIPLLRQVALREAVWGNLLLPEKSDEISSMTRHWVDQTKPTLALRQFPGSQRTSLQMCFPGPLQIQLPSKSIKYSEKLGGVFGHCNNYTGLEDPSNHGQNEADQLPGMHH